MTIISRGSASLAVVAASALLVAACGSSSSGNSNRDDSGSSPTTITGKAADGYLVDAKVCLDLNGNKACDDSEPSATTGPGGSFTLEVDAADANRYPIVVEVIKDLTYDEDTPGQRADKPYVLSAPAGQPQFVSPLTTAVQGIIEQNPTLDAAAAASVVSQSLGAGNKVDLFKDYVEAKKSEPAYERVHKVAQVAAKVLAETQAAIEEAATTEGIDTTARRQDVMNVVVGELIGKLNEAVRVVDQAGESFDVNAVNLVDVSSLKKDLSAKLDRAKEQSELKVATMPEILSEGAYQLVGDVEDGYWYVESKTDGQNTLQETIYTHDGSWIIDPIDDSGIWLTIDGKWELLGDDFAWTVSPAANGGAAAELPKGAGKLTMTAAQLDVAGKKIRDYLQSRDTQPFAAGIPADAIFSPEAVAYRVSVIEQSDSYEIEYYTGDDEQAGYCPELSDNCNFVWGNGDGPTKSFEELIYPDKASASQGFTGLGDDLLLRFIEGGTIQITDESDDMDESYHDDAWEYQDFRGHKVIVLTVPESFTNRMWDNRQIFYAVHDGYVRAGSFALKGDTEISDGFWFNSTAMEDIKNYFEPPAQ